MQNARNCDERRKLVTNNVSKSGAQLYEARREVDGKTSNVGCCCFDRKLY